MPIKSGTQLPRAVTKALMRTGHRILDCTAQKTGRDNPTRWVFGKFR
jgi:hypothetical protein